MALYKSAQVSYSDDTNSAKDEVILYEDAPSNEDMVEVHMPSFKPQMVIEEEFVVPELPGSELPLEVVENESAAHEAKTKEDENKAEEGKPKNPRDLGHYEGRVEDWGRWVVDNTPKHSGQYIGLLRARNHMWKAISDMEKTFSQDHEGKLDIGRFNGVHGAFEDAIDRLDRAIELAEKTKARSRKKADGEQDGIVKEAFTPKFQGWIVAVPGYISRIARGLISSTVSHGHDIGIQFKEQVKKYSLDLKDQASLLQVLEDSGYPLRQDKLLAPDDEIEVSNDGQSRELNVNYYS